MTTKYNKLAIFRKFVKQIIKIINFIFPNFIARKIKNFFFELLVYLKSLSIKISKKITFINHPLVLVGQIQRSGGTLLTQLFDNHPDLISHPSEIYIGYPEKWNWPRFDVHIAKKIPKAIFKKFSNKITKEGILFGYSKFSNKKNDNEIFDFKFNFNNQKKIFENLMNQKKIKKKRDIFNVWFTSYFNSFQGIFLKRKKYIFGFTPRFNLFERNLINFFNDYPDGKIIHIIRNPINWYSSSKLHNREYQDLVKSINLWSKSTSKAIILSRKYKNFKIILFEDLVSKTEKTTKLLCKWLKIKWKKSLLIPTYNGNKIKADTSFKVKTSGKILKETLNRSQYLSKKEIDYINKKTQKIYLKAKKKFKI